MRKWTVPSVLLLLCLLSLISDQGQKLHAKAEDDSDSLLDPPKVEEKLGAVPNGLSTDSDVVKRESEFLSLTDKEVLGEGDNAKLDIQIKLDKEKKILSIRDRGIGMTKEDLIKNLGTIAKSGTSAFVEKMQTSTYGNQRLTEHLQSLRIPGMNPWDVELKLDCISGKKLERRLYSLVEESCDEDETSAESSSSDDGESEKSEDEDAEDKPKTKTIKETTHEWELLNDVKAIWLRNPKEVTEEEYTKFYHSLAKDFGDEKDPDEANDKDKKDVENSSDDEKKGQYAKFWNEFGKSIKLGIIEDSVNRNRLAKLLRFETTKSDDPVDEYLMQYLMDYGDQKFQNVSKEGLKMGKDSKAKELKESFKDLTKWWKSALASENVDDVKISNRLADTPCVVVTSKFCKGP
ncbi:hypothetical protein OIU84_005130 [Salix udensis]|uniref:Uncharacterized protein n=1 Tax=Salix udensis TaxID=889485 RepID=A0AAD6JVC8_9ROSI|nr:hypothetical protein OIU84_005130 [Salix udensis]